MQRVLSRLKMLVWVQDQLSCHAFYPRINKLVSARTEMAALESIETLDTAAEELVPTSPTATAMDIS